MNMDKKKIKIKHWSKNLYPLLYNFEKSLGIEFSGKYKEEQQKLYEEWKVSQGL